MGQKVHPIGFRLGYTKTWDSRWFANNATYGELLREDIRLREELRRQLGHAGVGRIEIERAANKLRITIHAARPGIVIGRKGAEVERLRETIQARTGREVYINIQEITKPETNAQLVAEGVAAQLVRRIAFRRAMRKAIESTVRFGAKGVKLRCSGRLNGADIARSEWYSEGRMPLHTLRADIEYGEAVARTTYGAIGVKVWIYQGDTSPDLRDRPPDRLT